MTLDTLEIIIEIRNNRQIDLQSIKKLRIQYKKSLWKKYIGIYKLAMFTYLLFIKYRWFM